MYIVAIVIVVLFTVLAVFRALGVARIKSDIINESTVFRSVKCGADAVISIGAFLTLRDVKMYSKNMSQSRIFSMVVNYTDYMTIRLIEEKFSEYIEVDTAAVSKESLILMQYNLRSKACPVSVLAGLFHYSKIEEPDRSVVFICDTMRHHLVELILREYGKDRTPKNYNEANVLVCRAFDEAYGIVFK